MTSLTLEIGENQTSGPCHCCGQDGSTGHGFIYKDGYAHSVYYVGWSGAHPERGVSLALAIGEWAAGTTIGQRTCVGLDAYEGQSHILFRFIDPSESPWPDTDLLGPMLDREKAMTHPLKGNFLELGELIVRSHPAVAKFLKC